MKDAARGDKSVLPNWLPPNAIEAAVDFGVLRNASSDMVFFALFDNSKLSC